MNCKFLTRALSFTALALLLPSQVFAATCSPSIVVGIYGFATQGYFLTGVGQPVTGKSHLVALTGTYRFNADLTVNRAFTISIDGVASDATDSGTYIIDSDCKGQALFNAPFGLEPINLTIVGQGGAIMFLNAAPGIVLSGRMERQ